MRVLRLAAKGFSGAPIPELGGVVLVDGDEILCEPVYANRLMIVYNPRFKIMLEEDVDGLSSGHYDLLGKKVDQPKPSVDQDPISEPKEETEKTTKHNRGMFGWNKKKAGVKEK